MASGVGLAPTKTARCSVSFTSERVHQIDFWHTHKMMTLRSSQKWRMLQGVRGEHHFQRPREVTTSPPAAHGRMATEDDAEARSSRATRRGVGVGASKEVSRGGRGVAYGHRACRFGGPVAVPARLSSTGSSSTLHPAHAPGQGGMYKGNKRCAKCRLFCCFAVPGGGLLVSLSRGGGVGAARGGREQCCWAIATNAPGRGRSTKTPQHARRQQGGVSRSSK